MPIVDLPANIASDNKVWFVGFWFNPRMESVPARFQSKAF